MSRKRQQVSVPLNPALRQFVERQAAAEDRTVAGQIRHLIAEAARQAQLARGRRPQHSSLLPILIGLIAVPVASPPSWICSRKGLEASGPLVLARRLHRQVGPTGCRSFWPQVVIAADLAMSPIRVT